PPPAVRRKGPQPRATLDCCEYADSGHAAADAATILMNSRRLIAAPRLQLGNRTGKDQCTERGHRCLLWVKSRHLRRKKSCPLYPRKRTCAVQLGTSALGQKRTSRNRQVGGLVAFENTAGINPSQVCVRYSRSVVCCHG